MDAILLRSAALRVAFVFALVLVMTGLSSSRARAQTDVAHVASALYTPVREGDQVVWKARWVLDVYDASAIASGRTLVIHFAAPLPEGETMDHADGIEPITTDKRLVGVRVDARGLSDRSVLATLRQPVAKSDMTGIPLGAPIATGTAAQIVDGDLGGGARLEVTGARGIERHVGYTAPAEIGHAAREEARRLTGYAPRVTGAPLYVRGEDVRNQGTLSADVATSAERKSHGRVAVGLGFAMAVGALIVAMKKLSRRASVERADAVLAAEIDRGA
jgi:hypothetical protein